MSEPEPHYIVSNLLFTLMLVVVMVSVCDWAVKKPKVAAEDAAMDPGTFAVLVQSKDGSMLPQVGYVSVHETCRYLMSGVAPIVTRYQLRDESQRVPRVRLFCLPGMTERIILTFEFPGYACTEQVRSPSGEVEGKTLRARIDCLPLNPDE